MFLIECFEKTVLNTLENIQKNVCSGVFLMKLHVYMYSLLPTYKLTTDVFLKRRKIERMLWNFESFKL